MFLMENEPIQRSNSKKLFVLSTRLLEEFGAKTKKPEIPDDGIPGAHNPGTGRSDALGFSPSQKLWIPGRSSD
jgi:hypothetical protein